MYEASTPGLRISLARRLLPGLAAAMLVLIAAVADGTDTYVPSAQQLTIPALQIGNATYSDVIVVIHDIVTPPSGSSPNGSTDTYDPATGLLTVQSVQAGGHTYYNAVVTVASLVSIGSVSGADTFDGTHLKIPSVSIGGAHYANVTVSASTANVVRVSQGLPESAGDHYDPASGYLTIAAVQFGGRTYTNVVVTASLNDIVSVGNSVALAKVQRDVFTPYCSDCHGTGGLPPNLQSISTSGVATINVPSGEQPAVPYVKPGDPDGSYLMRKLLGVSSITGRQMPGDAYALPQSNIDEVRSWIQGL